MTYTKLPVIQVIQKSISFAWFSKGLNFSWTPKCGCMKPSFIQFKIRLFEMSMFRLNWLKRWENVYLNEFVPNSDHKIFKFKTIEKHFFISYFRNFQNIMHKYLKHTFIHFVHVMKKFFFQKVHVKSVSRTELQIVPDWSYHP